MKKLFISLGVIVVIILAAAFIIPVVFKDDIKAAIDSAIAENVNADVVFDTDDFSLSLFSNFPNVTAGMNNLGVINRAPFEGQILFAIKEFEVEIDLFSLFGDQIKISGIKMVEPEINIKVLEDGTANYDIAMPSSETEVVDTPVEETPTAFNIGIDHWEITNAHVVYDDATMPIKLEIKNMNHSGSGDFNQDVFDLKTLTSTESVSVTYDGVEYLSNKKVNADVVMSISNNYSTYTFKENKATVNDFGLSFDGFLTLNEDGSMDMDISYASKEATFKSLLSLVPGVYTADFGKIETAGNLSFNGAVKGKYDSLTMPAFNVGLQVNEAMFKYPDLPTAVSNISMDLLIDNKDGNIDNTIVDLKQFHMDFGKNPIDAKLLIKNLVNYDMDASVKGKLDLAELSSMFPMEGMSMKGAVTLDIQASGVYDSITGQMPTVNATMKMANGYVKTTDLPYALEKMTLDAVVKSPGKLADFIAVVNEFSMEMDGEPFKVDLEFANLDNYTWKLNASGGIDLEKITKIFPLEGMTLAGKIKANLSTAGNMADLEAEKYDRLPTSGQINITNFKYVDAELPYDVTISAAQASFDPNKMGIDNYKGTIGKSDIALSGSMSNYIGFLFGENQVLKGKMNFSSNLLDLNEFMTEEEGSTVVATDSTGSEESYGVVDIPKNIDFVLTSSIKTISIMDMSMTNTKGDVIVKDGVVNLSGLIFNLLGGAFAVNGTYDPRDLAKPKYDFKLKIDNLSASKAYETFTIVQGYFPIAKNIDGNISTDFKINGLLDQEMMPDMNTVNGAGLINLANGTLKNSDVLKGVGSLIGASSLSNTDQIPIKDVLMSMTIENGLVTIKPFDLTMAGYKSSLGGTSTLGGALDFDLKMDVPAGKLGSQVNSLISQYTGGSPSNSSIIPLNIGIGGTADKPTFKLKSSGTKQKATDVVKNVVKDQVKEELGVDVDAERKKIMDQAQSEADKIIAEGKKAAEKVRKEGYAQADQLVKEAGSNPLKKRVAEAAAKKMKQETDDTANGIESESKKKADALLAAAKKKADEIK
ncbi:MAG TPA: AsmA-like C-terminal region-containing protein [Fulvivirga sp.]|nr:AsmA-like C-terminal region-containing protein [Fulvivirga sp.]